MLYKMTVSSMGDIEELEGKCQERFDFLDL
jgi:hypothetical protein